MALTTFLRREARHLDQLNKRLVPALARVLGDKSQRLAQRGKLLDALSYKAVLARGFALVTNSRDQLVRSPSDARPGEVLTITLGSDEAIKAAVTGAPATRARPRIRAAAEEELQAKLF